MRNGKTDLNAVEIFTMDEQQLDQIIRASESELREIKNKLDLDRQLHRFGKLGVEE